MKIENAQINAFGNLENKQIDLSENINIIKGNNESGKSTFLKFIVDIFYGISKNKRGKEFSDYDRYKPWNSEEFSGKIAYTLDNGKKYEVFRDFNKKNPKIYNEVGEDISKEFTIDKTNGSKFFVEQTKIEEDTFLSTFVSCQTEVKLEKQEQNVLVQKLANLAGTGEDNVSYKKALEKLNKKQIEEIGTLRTTGRPMNLVKEEQFNLQDEIGELEEYKEERYLIEENKNKLETKIQENEKKLEMLKQINKIYEDKKLEEQKLELNKNLIKSYDEKIKNIKEEKYGIETKYKEIVNIMNEKTEKQEKENKQTTKLRKIGVSILFVISIIIGIIFIKNTLVSAIAFVIGAINIILLVESLLRKNKSNEPKKEESEQQVKIRERLQLVKSEMDKMQAQIEMLNKSKEEKNAEIEKQKQEINSNIEERLNRLREIYQ